MFAKTQRCCIKGCDSHECSTENIGSFQFPMHDETLLKKWLRQIDVPNWRPSACHRICSMHFRSDDIVSRPNDRQPYLKLTSIPTIFPVHPVEVVNLNGTSPPLKPEETQQATKFINVIGDARAVQAGPMILIRAQYPGEIPAPFPLQMVVQSVNQTSLSNSMQISAQYVKQIAAANSQIALQNSAQIERVNQMNVQSYPMFGYLNHSGVQHLPQIDARHVAQIVAQSAKPIFAQSPAPHLEQVALKSIADIGDQYSRQDQRTRLRKILPKPQLFRPEAPPDARRLRKPRRELAANATPRPEALAVPRIEDPRPKDSGEKIVARYPGNKRPILRISIDREYDLKNMDSPTGKVERRCLRSDTKAQSAEKANSTPREMTIENPATNKAVTFTLDPETGEIVVTTRQLDDPTRDDAQPESAAIERKVDATHTPGIKLRQLYIKGQQECIALERRLRVLRRRHREEQEEIQKLEEHLTVLDDEVPKTRCEDPAESRCAKRRETEKNCQLDDRESSPLPRVKRTKEDFPTEPHIRSTPNPATRPNDWSTKKENRTSGNCDSHTIEIGSASEEETADKTVGNCDVARTANEAPADFDGRSESEHSVYETEFVDSELFAD